MAEHGYTARIQWTGNRGHGTARYNGALQRRVTTARYNGALQRRITTAPIGTWNVQTPGKPLIDCSNDPVLGGDPACTIPKTC